MTRQRTKQIAAVVLIAAVGAIWVPPLLEQSRSRKAPGTDAEPAEMHDVAESSGSTTESASSDLQGFGDMLRMLRGRFDRDDSYQTPQEVTQASIPTTEDVVVEKLPELPVRQPVFTPVVREGEPEVDPAIEAFLSSHTLKATLVAGESSKAIWGNYIVRAGDEFVDGAIRVTEVKSNAVVLDVRGDRKVIQLPPLEARAASTSSSNDTTTEMMGEEEPTEEQTTPSTEDSSPTLEAIESTLEQQGESE